MYQFSDITNIFTKGNIELKEAASEFYKLKRSAVCPDELQKQAPLVKTSLLRIIASQAMKCAAQTQLGGRFYMPLDLHSALLSCMFPKTS